MSASDERKGLLERLTYQRLLLASAMIFLVLPFVTAFNEFLTAIVMRVQLYVLIQDMIVPVEVRMVGAVLRYLFGIDTSVTSSSLLLQGAGRAVAVKISWNCIGWQSFILFIFTVITGLQGPYTKRSKILCLLLGLEGTFLINLGRIVLIILVAFFWGYLPAIIIHDYGGTIIILAWLFLFWHFSTSHVLRRVPEVAEAEG